MSRSSKYCSNACNKLAYRARQTQKAQLAPEVDSMLSERGLTLVRIPNATFEYEATAPNGEIVYRARSFSDLHAMLSCESELEQAIFCDAEVA